MDSAGTVIAIDGPSGSGKSTAASMLASRLDYALVDSGAMYRAVALLSLEREVGADDEQALAGLAHEVVETFAFACEDGSYRSFLSGRDVSREIREVDVARRVSDVSVHPAVREEMVRLQRRIVDGRDSVVEGRDIGTVVFPDARLKVYMVAGESVRAERRHAELYGKGGPVTREDIASVMRERDRIDSSRKMSPLRPASDAVLLDTTDMSPGDVLERLLKECRERGIDAGGRA